MVAIDMSAAVKAPPRKVTAKARPNTQNQASQTSVTDARTAGLIGLGQLGQGVCIMAGLYADAGTIGQYWGPVATELANVAAMEGNEWLAKPIDLLIQVGPFGALLAAILPMGLQFAANHGKIDATRVAGQGIVPPEVLEAQMRAEMSRMQADALRRQQEAMLSAREAQREYDELLEKSREPEMAAAA
jgi:hypothetical protein